MRFPRGKQGLSFDSIHKAVVLPEVFCRSFRAGRKRRLRACRSKHPETKKESRRALNMSQDFDPSDTLTDRNHFNRIFHQFQILDAYKIAQIAANDRIEIVLPPDCSKALTSFQ